MSAVLRGHPILTMTESTLTPPTTQIITLEEIATRVIVEVQQLGAMQSGQFGSAVFPRIVLDPSGDAPPSHEIIHAVQLEDAVPGYDPSCPRNFETVAGSAQKNNLPLATALQYYTKSRLRYSCVSTIAQFVEGVIPKLREQLGTTEVSVRSRLCQRRVVVDLNDLQFLDLQYVPHQRHAFYESGNLRTVETFLFGDPFATHCILQCCKTGMVLDLTLGQMNGDMRPAIFESFDDYQAAFPGKILKKTPKELQEIGSDLVFQSMKRASPDFLPVPFGKRVWNAIISGKGSSYYCAMCLGVASLPQHPLKSCSKCKQVIYCGRSCQKLHWTEHKTVCVVPCGVSNNNK